MKSTLILILGLIMSLPLTAQTEFNEADILQTSFGMARREIVKSFVILKDDQTEAFWKLYDEYDTKRMKYGKERIELLTDYAQKWDSLTSEEADKMVLKSIDLNKKTDKLITSYYKKIKKNTSTGVAIKFYEVETYIRATIHFYVKNTIPFVNQE